MLGWKIDAAARSGGSRKCLFVMESITFQQAERRPFRVGAVETKWSPLVQFFVHEAVEGVQRRVDYATSRKETRVIGSNGIGCTPNLSLHAILM